MKKLCRKEALLLIFIIIWISNTSVFANSSKIGRVDFPKKQSVYVKSSRIFKVAAPYGIKASKIRWSSSNPEIVRVKNKKGTSCKVSFLKEGKATLFCYVKGKKKESVKCKITVKKCKKIIKKLKISNKVVSMYVGDTCQNNYKIKPDGVNVKKQLVFTSSRESVATVNKRGVVTAKKAGTTVIKAKTIDGSRKTVSFIVRVSEIDASEHSVYLSYGDTYTCKLNGRADTSGMSAIKWSSSDEKVATVDQNGIVTGKGLGTAKITAKIDNALGQETTIDINVILKDFEIELPEETDNYYVGKKYKFKMKGLKEGERIYGINWSSSNTAVASIDQSGLVTGKGLGTTRITAEVDCAGGQSSTVPLQIHFKIERDSTRFIAHRGFSSEAPDNTIRAFMLAGEAGFWGAETDIRKTKDGHFVCFHDDSLYATCGDSRKVGDLTLDEIQEIMIIKGSNYDKYKNDEKAIRIPTLEEYLAVCKKYNMVPVIEIKQKYDHKMAERTVMPKTGEDAEPVVELYDPEKEDVQKIFEVVDSIMGNRPYVFIDSDYKTLVKLKEILPENKKNQVTFQYIVYNYTSNMNEICRKYGFDFDLDYAKNSDATIAALRKDGFDVNIWTVNRKIRVENALSKGIEFITTNYKYW